MATIEGVATTTLPRTHTLKTDTHKTEDKFKMQVAGAAKDSNSEATEDREEDKGAVEDRTRAKGKTLRRPESLPKELPEHAEV